MREALVPNLGASTLLLEALRDPATSASLSPDQWDLLLRLARRTRLLGRLEADLASCGLMASIPKRVANHLIAARNMVGHRQTLLTWELNRVLWALDGSEIPVIVLKGVAYVLAGLPSARGRWFADLDVLVPESRITQVEETLLSRGWNRTRVAPYDERYYRVWMHEIPPLRHRERETEIDIHHSIVPRTSRLRSDASQLVGSARRLSDARIMVLSPTDMVLHTLVHLFLEGDPQEGLRLRDLLDVHDLLDYFGQNEPGFWEELVPRAHELGLIRPLFYGLRFAGRLFGTRIPGAVFRDAQIGAPLLPVRALMDRLVPLALLPDHPDFPRRKTLFARWLIYIRAHWMRMPLGLLASHLGYKGWLRVRGKWRDNPKDQTDRTKP